MANLFDFLFPAKCVNCNKFGSFLCDNCFSRISYNQAFQCPVCLKPSVNGLTHPICMSPYSINGAIWAVSYGPVIRRLVHKFKYRPHLSKLASSIGEILVEGLTQNQSFYSFIEKFNPVIVPIPLSKKKYRERGYNHAELLGSYVAQYFKLKLEPGVLIRVKDTKPQFKLTKDARRKNIIGAFEVAKEVKTPPSIILLDDIATSFATLKEAAKVLKRRGAENVLAVTFAREV